jgi:hypothetical protein
LGLIRSRTGGRDEARLTTGVRYCACSCEGRSVRWPVFSVLY